MFRFYSNTKPSGALVFLSFVLALALGLNLLWASSAVAAGDCGPYGAASIRCLNGSISSTPVLGQNGVYTWTCSGGQGIVNCSSASTPPTTPPKCGNGILEAGEACDGINFGSKTCASYGYTTGKPFCDQTCNIITRDNKPFGCSSPAPVAVCGNGKVEGAESCDGTNLNNKTCQSLGFASGSLSCSACQFRTSACVKASTPSTSTGSGSNANLCGTSAQQCSNPGFVYDPVFNRIVTCASLNRGSGVPVCNPTTCTMNLSSCSGAPVTPPVQSGSNPGELGTEPDEIVNSNSLSGIAGPNRSQTVSAKGGNPCPGCGALNTKALLIGNKLSFDPGASLCSPYPNIPPVFDPVNVNDCKACWKCQDPYGNTGGPCCVDIETPAVCGPTCYTCADGSTTDYEYEPKTGTYVCNYTCESTCGAKKVDCCYTAHASDGGNGEIRRTYTACGGGGTSGGGSGGSLPKTGVVFDISRLFIQ